MKVPSILTSLALALGLLCAPSRAQDKPLRPGTAQTLDTRIGKLQFTHDFASGYPTKETIERLYDERDFQRACQVYLWSIPAVSFAHGSTGRRRSARATATSPRS